ncbi:Hypothetical protein R9X50_00359200 [Acrodontium crateriforme]|uniref:Carboxylic ester hydrolase n=1 Tax=Acrodontium crateriforme TaxID=150365 RepID=A0AAQ3M2T6_9PEZI|nr:Hypothetical protein R9X50_00359200 [Acrodontium crateriforme]
MASLKPRCPHCRFDHSTTSSHYSTKMLRLFSLLPLLAIPVIGAPTVERTTGPSVTIANGTVIGSTAAGIDSFKGIPFAQPPVGNLRLRAPQSIKKSFGTINAVGVPTSCPQFNSQTNTSSLPQDVAALLVDSPLVQTVTGAGEDCLTLNIQRPSTATSSSKLPVLFWIYGGGFESGSTQIYDGSILVEKSISLGKPIIYVAVNYRLGGFGFLAGKDLAKEGNTNLGLRDQRLGMQWVAENIAAFGGDPNKVTIWGESAGSISVFDHLVINGGDNTYKGKPLFRGAIMDSGTAIPTDQVTAPQAQAIYQTVVNNAGCGGASNKLTCLRSTDYETYLNAVNSVPGIFSYRSLDLSYLPRPDSGNRFFSASPETVATTGKFAKVPMIIGDQEDEGTLFSLVLSNVTTNQQVIDYLASYFPNNPTAETDVTGLVANYPDEPLLGQPSGSPFRTGSLNNIFPQYKRLAAILGDVTFTLTRRVALTFLSKKVKVWSYLNTYLYGTSILGTLHGSDILVSYGYTTNLVPPAAAVQQYYIAFVNNLDPNSLGTPAPLIPWPQWTSSNPQLVNFEATQLSYLTDDFRSGAFNYISSKPSAFRV